VQTSHVGALAPFPLLPFPSSFFLLSFPSLPLTFHSPFLLFPSPPFPSHAFLPPFPLPYTSSPLPSHLPPLPSCPLPPVLSLLSSPLLSLPLRSGERFSFDHPQQVWADPGRRTVFGEFQAKNLASSSKDLQELFRK